MPCFHVASDVVTECGQRLVDLLDYLIMMYPAPTPLVSVLFAASFLLSVHFLCKLFSILYTVLLTVVCSK